jgi:hypothetical protein
VLYYEAYYPACGKFEDEAIDGRSDQWQVGLTMMSLLEGTRVRLAHSKQELDQYLQYTPEYDRTYFKTPETLVFDCLTADPTRRPSLSKDLYKTKKGLANWQKASGDVSGDEVLELFRVPLEEKDPPIHTVLG